MTPQQVADVQASFEAVKPIADTAACEHEYGVGLTAWDALPKASAMVAAVSHREYAAMGIDALAERLLPGGVFADVKCFYDPDAVASTGAKLWRL